MSLRTKLLLLSLLDADPALGGLAVRAADGDDAAARPGRRAADDCQVLSRVVASEPELLYRVP